MDLEARRRVPAAALTCLGCWGLELGALVYATVIWASHVSRRARLDVCSCARMRDAQGARMGPGVGGAGLCDCDLGFAREYCVSSLKAPALGRQSCSQLGSGSGHRCSDDQSLCDPCHKPGASTAFA